MTLLSHSSLNLRSVLTGLLSMALLAGCSSVPETIRNAPANAPGVAEVRQAAPGSYQGTEVRWGGTIARVENRQNETLVEIVARETYSDGEPKPLDTSPGRFIARIDTFLDPAIYATGRRLTVVGTVSESIERTLDQMEYRYPVVSVSRYHLWPALQERDERYDDPWMYDPWYPWHPWSPWPYYPPYYY